MTFVISGLSPRPFTPLFDLTDEALNERGMQRRRVDAKPGFPCRVTLQDAEIGETVLLLNHEHQPARTPYRSRHAIFVREGATEVVQLVDAIPSALASRLLSVRAFDEGDMMLDADVVEGGDLSALIDQMLTRPDVRYLHVHYAKRGCYAARVDRA
jgi:hypothetical protein